MLSKKMAVSLTSLITIFALAFVVSSAMAGDFSTAITARGHDISHADGHQLPVATTDVIFDVVFGRVVTTEETAADVVDADFVAGDVIVRAYDANGAVVDIAATDISVAASTPDNGKNYRLTVTITSDVSKLYVQIPQGKVVAADPTVAAADSKNEKKDITVTFLAANPGDPSADPPTGQPDVLKIARVGEPFATITSAEFMVHVLLTEDAKTEDPTVGGLTTDLIDVGDNATVNSVVKLASPAGTKTVTQIGGLVAADGTAVDGDTVLNTLDTWRDGMLHLYLVTIGTKPGEKTVTVKVKDFAGMERPAPGKGQEMYLRAADGSLVEGRDKLTVKTKTADPKTPKAAGLMVKLPKEKYIPGSGYLVVAENAGDAALHVPGGEIKEAPKTHERNAAEMIYNVITVDALPNLETFLSNGGIIDVVGPQALKITEIMWGSDASLGKPGNSQWIELYNAGAGFQTADDDGATTAYESVTLIFYNPSELSFLPARSTVHDRVGTVNEAGLYWSLAGKGSSGASGKRIKDEEATVQVPVVSPIISMNRVMDAAGMVADGTMATSWTQSNPPSSNFEANAPGVHIGSPGAAPVTYTPPPVEEVEEEAPVIEAAMPDEIMITEIMVDTDNGRLPQWIELTYSGMDKATLNGWDMVIDNAIDAGVLGGGNAITISLSGVMVDVSKNPGNMGKGQSVLVVAWAAARKSDNIRMDRVINVGAQLGQTGRYKLLSADGFRITLVPPDQQRIAAFGDIAGNLHEDWDIPMSEGSARSSLIRYEMLESGTATMGTDANGWVLADGTPLNIGQESYYGDDEDNSTPGQHAGGPLPVELSHFRPARDKQTGAVVITWATQSELNNAGFFIKRSQQCDGAFKVINAAMVPGAGTTSEKQFYTYTDTTAQPNVVYYYQIEDVSLDGNRQTLTRGTRLKGHIGAAGKATVIWGEIKASNE